MAKKKTTKRGKESEESAHQCGCACGCCSPNENSAKDGSDSQMCCSEGKFWSWMCKPFNKNKK